MAPVLAERAMSLLTKRDNCYEDIYGNVRCYNSGWYNWGRWVLLGIIILFFVLVVLCLACTSRRRRSRGARPMYGTGWMSQGPLAPPPYTPAQPAPAYSTHPEPQHGNYAPPMQPKPTYGAPQQEYPMNDYAPPSGPPPQHYR